MPLQVSTPLHVATVAATTTSVANGQTAQAVAPFAGRVIQVGAATGAAVTATADATCTTSINGVAIPNAAFLVTNGTAAFTPTTNGVASASTVNAGDTISWAFTGTGTGGGTTNVFAQVRRGTF